MSASQPPRPDNTASRSSTLSGSALTGDADDSRLVSEIENTVASKSPPLAPDAAYAGLRPKELGQALTGQRIGDVLLEQFIGGGGMGAVFRGRDLALQRTVAVKVLATQHATDGETQRRFEVEAQSAARLDHPNIARVHSVGEDRGMRYIVFEYIEGTNIRDLVAANGPLAVGDAVSFAIQITDALEHAWRRDVVHRDIKPSNILVTRDGLAKLVDMGLARLRQVDEASHELTASGTTLGTFDYIAPEQARDPRNADTRSDIYSLGCTLFYMLTGRPPFPEGTVVQKLLRHQGDDPPDLRAARPGAPVELARVLERMLAKRPEDRFADPRALRERLMLVGSRLGVAPANLVRTLPASDHAWTPLRKHAPWIIALVVLLVAALFWPRAASREAPPEPFEELETPSVARPIE